LIELMLAMQEPPHGPEMIECPDCEGEGIIFRSDCCDAIILGEDICSECKDCCDGYQCNTCNGEGEVRKDREEE
jgi:DnaJ-class molecular chaperone